MCVCRASSFMQLITAYKQQLSFGAANEIFELQK